MSNAAHHSFTLDRVPWQQAFKTSIGTSLLFMVFYSGSALITDMRAVADPNCINTWRYDWEIAIPFVPVMIVPYMSIDLLFVLAPFFCHDRKELSILGKRLSAIVAVASICYLIYPLKLAVARPEASGFFGEIYNWFISVDSRPYNLCPSMHIALRTVLAAHYGKHSSGLLRFVMNLWFFLIGCSTLLLYQHHVIDVVGGFVLAALVMYAIDGIPWKQSSVGGAKFAWMYAFASLLLLLPMTWFPPLGWLVIWPAVASALVALGYAALGPAVYRRQNGRLSWPARIVLAPVLAAQWLSWKYYGRQSNPMDHIADGVWLGRHLSETEAERAIAEHVGAVVDVCNAFDEPSPFLKIPRLELPILDLTAPSEQQLKQAVEFIELHRDRGVLVHCKAGYSRSAAIVAAWLVRSGRAESGRPESESAKAFSILKKARPNIVIRPEIQTLSLAGTD